MRRFRAAVFLALLLAPTAAMLRGTPPYITVEPDLGMVQLGNQARTVGVDAPRTIDFHRRPGTNAIWADGDVPDAHDVRSRRDRRGPHFAALAEHASPPLRRVLEPVLRLSHNWYAEMLLKTLERVLTGTGSWDSGLAVERRFLVDTLHVDSSAFRFADGSGLSHWTTPSGYLETPAGPWTFSIQLNNHTLSTRDVQKRIDQIVAELER